MSCFSLSIPRQRKSLYINDISDPEMTELEKSDRRRMAQLFHILRLYGAENSIYDQISLKLSENEFLINPFGLMAWEITASKLVKITALDLTLGNNFIHNHRLRLFSYIYSARPDVRCIVNLQTVDTQAFSCISFNKTFSGFDSLVVGRFSAIDFKYEFDEEFLNFLNTELLTMCRVIVLKNYGALVMAKSVEEAFYISFHLLRICEIELKSQKHRDDSTMAPPVDSKKTNKDFNDRGIEFLEFEAHLRLITEIGIINDGPDGAEEKRAFADTYDHKRELYDAFDTIVKKKRSLDPGTRARSFEIDDRYGFSSLDSQIGPRYSPEQVPSIESSKELIMRISSSLASDISQINIDSGIVKVAVNSKRGKGLRPRLIRRSKSLSGVERALFRKTAEDLICLRK